MKYFYLILLAFLVSCVTGGTPPGPQPTPSPTIAPTPQPTPEPTPVVVTPGEKELSLATVYNSPVDIASWPVTTKITRLELSPRGVKIDFTKKGTWPQVPYMTPGETLEYTLWILIKVNGQWYTSGCIEYWTGLEYNGGPVNEYAKNWYYAADRWHEMTGHQPAVGEEVGFFVAAGDHRNNGVTISKERSNVVMLKFPDANGGVYQ